VASGSGSIGLGGADKSIVPCGKGVREGERYTPGITALKDKTRVAKVAVDVGVALAVTVAVLVAVKVCVGVYVIVGKDVVVGRAEGVSEGSTIKVGKSSADRSFSNGTERKAAMPHTTTQAISKIQSVRRRIVTSSSAPPSQSSKSGTTNC
jgi:hypothetical protein